MDREADSYELFDRLKSNNISYVIRIRQDRGTTQKESKLFDVLEGASIAGTRTVKLSRRKAGKFPSDRKIHKPRKSRKTKLCLAAKSIELKKSLGLSKELSPCLVLNFVHVWEENPPENCEPVNWKLVTTEPIETFEQIEEIVDYYQARWVIEEYFKAVKTGCSYEQRQQESYHALLNVLAVFLPIAWWLLSLKTLARNDPTRSSVGLVSKRHLEILAARFPEIRHSLNTAEGVLYAVAKLGGHIKYNGPPGWQTLYSGFQDLIKMEVGWLLHASSIHCDK